MTARTPSSTFHAFLFWGLNDGQGPPHNHRVSRVSRVSRCAASQVSTARRPNSRPRNYLSGSCHTGVSKVQAPRPSRTLGPASGRIPSDRARSRRAVSALSDSWEDRGVYPLDLECNLSGNQTARTETLGDLEDLEDLERSTGGTSLRRQMGLGTCKYR